MTRSSILARASKRAVRQYVSDYELPAKTMAEILAGEARRARLRHVVDEAARRINPALRRLAEKYSQGGHVSTVRRIVGPTILLSSGAYFNFLDPVSCDFTIDDIAVGLSNICRFAGQCDRFYSVAQHSCHVSDLLPPEHAFAGLMHDAPEAFLGDVAKPLKVMLPDYIRLEKEIEPVVLGRFGVSLPLPAAVKEIDVVMLATEQRQLMKNRDYWNYTRGQQPADLVIPDWSTTRARYEFMARFNRLAPLTSDRGDTS